MSKLAYRTLGNEHPQGKPKVYFASYPDELNSFIDEYALKIQRIQNCAIWYETEYEAEYDIEELEAQLTEMQLIVMPVTTKLLTKPNRAMDIEFEIAQNKHIPVLPIMMEDGLLDVYNKRFRNLQFLDPNDKDPSRREFSEVLESYIKAMLIGDEQAEKVRNAFDAYIFLSYRKKDRAKAQRLMRLIHKNPMFQSIAIWYDEFLTPGEDFNDLISAMLNKSNVFALAVTPNLVNETNYVMTTEYPAAVKANKAVLPVELEETDRDLLTKQFKGIPEVIPEDNEKSLDACLKDHLHAIAFSEESPDAEHSFLIGLAYLHGIDVEVDSEKALRLITAAAEAEVPEAIEQLAFMYETGKGVSRNYHEGINWRKRHTEVLYERYEKDPDDDGLQKYNDSLRDLGDAYYALRMLPEAYEVYEDSRYSAEEYKNTELKNRLISESEQKMGSAAEALGQFDKAKKHYETALTVSKEFSEKTGDAKDRMYLCACYDRLGQLAKSQNRLKEAGEYFEKSLETGKKLAEETGRIIDRRNLSTSYERLGDIAKLQGRSEEARSFYEHALDISLASADETKDILARRDVSVTYNKLGELEELGNAEKAKEYYQKSYQIRYELVEETETIEARRDLSVNCDNLGRIAEMQGKLEEARGYYVVSLGLSTSLAEEADTLESKRDLAVGFDNLSRIEEKMGDFDSALSFLNRSLLQWNGIAEMTKNDEAKMHMIQTLTNMAKINDKQRNYGKARAYYNACFDVLSGFPEEKLSSDIVFYIATLQNSLGELAEKEGKTDDACNCYMRSLDIRYALAKELNTVDAIDDLQAYYCKTGLFLLKNKLDLPTARKLFMSVLNIGKTDNPELRKRAEWAEKVLKQYFAGGGEQ